jgi:hypothetical protein
MYVYLGIVRTVRTYDLYGPFNMGGFGLIGYVPNSLYYII